MMSRKPQTREVVISRGGGAVARPPAHFNDIQRNMEDELEKRRKDWEKEVEAMSEDFFNVKIVKKDNGGSGSGRAGGSPSQRPLAGGTEILNIADSNDVYQVLPDGSKVFRQKFDVHGFEPGDLQVKVDGGIIRVTAKHEESFGGKNTSVRQFNRQVDVPENVNPDKLVSYLSPEGILTLEAPVEQSDEVVTPKRQVHQTIESSGSPFTVHETSTSPFRHLNTPPPQYQAIVRGSSPRGMGTNISSATVYNSPVMEDTKHGKKMKMVIKMGGDYDPEDIRVVLYDHKVSVKAKHEENIGGRSSKREFSRDFDLQKPLYKQSFRAVLTPDRNVILLGSLRENEDQREMAQVVYNDLPINGKPCTVEHA